MSDGKRGRIDRDDRGEGERWRDDLDSLRTALAAAERERDRAREALAEKTRECAEQIRQKYEEAGRVEASEQREAAPREALRKIRTNALDSRGVAQIRFAGIAATADAALSASPPGHAVIWTGCYMGTDTDQRETGWCDVCGREVYDGEGQEHRAGAASPPGKWYSEEQVREAMEAAHVAWPASEGQKLARKTADAILQRVRER